MAELKTRRTDASVAEFLRTVADEERRKDCRTLAAMMERATGARPRMWGPSIVGFGSYPYRYPSGREGEWFLAGFSPRKQDLPVYVMSGFAGHQALLDRLGRHKTGKSCLYLKRLSDVDLAALGELIERSVAQVARAHASSAPAPKEKRRPARKRRETRRG